MSLFIEFSVEKTFLKKILDITMEMNKDPILLKIDNPSYP